MPGGGGERDDKAGSAKYIFDIFLKKHINCSLSQLNIKAGLEIYSCGGKNVLAFSLFQDILQNIKGTLNAPYK